MNECCGKEIPFKYLEFIIIDVVNNTSGLTRNKILLTTQIITQKRKIFDGHSSNTTSGVK